MVPGFDQTASFYGRTGNGGFTTLLRAGVACRLAHVSRQPAATSANRAELAAMRNLMWDPAYAPSSETFRVVVDGVTGPDGSTPAQWQPVAGTLATMRGPDGSPIYRKADVRRQ
jgi:hypothetical protein